MDLKSLKNIPSSFSLAKKALIMCVIVSLLNTALVSVWIYYVTISFGETAYIITSNGQTALAKGLSTAEFLDYRKPEIKNHIKIFHRYFWNIDQFNIQKNIASALELIGDSGRQLYLSLQSKGHYSKIRTQNFVQSLVINDIKINTDTYPYKCEVFGKLKIRRTDNVKENVSNFGASFEVINVTRTDTNPHGLQIIKYEPK